MRKAILTLLTAATFLSCQKDEVLSNSVTEITRIEVSKTLRKTLNETNHNVSTQTEEEIKASLERFNSVFATKNNSVSRNLSKKGGTYRLIGCYKPSTDKFTHLNSKKTRNMFITFIDKKCGNQFDVAVRFIAGYSYDPVKEKHADTWYRMKLNFFTDNTDGSYTLSADQYLRSGSTERLGARPYYDYAYGILPYAADSFMRETDKTPLRNSFDVCNYINRNFSDWKIIDEPIHSNIYISVGGASTYLVFQKYGDV